MTSYQVMAKFYNKLMKDCDYEMWSQSLLNTIKKYCDGRSGIDLACGTGTITKLLASEGCKLIGIDSSEYMLSIAQGNTKGSNPKYICQSMTNFKVFNKVDFVSCVCDGINYLTGIEQVKQVFAKVYHCLCEKGVFIFDVSTKFKLTQVIGNNVFFEDTNEVTYLWSNQLNNDNVEMNLVFFTKSGKSYNREDERHVQYFYDEQVLIDMLNEVGFSSVTVNDNYSMSPLTSTTQRATFVCVKGSQ